MRKSYILEKMEASEFMTVWSFCNYHITFEAPLLKKTKHTVLYIFSPCSALYDICTLSNVETKESTFYMDTLFHEIEIFSENQRNSGRYRSNFTFICSIHNAIMYVPDQSQQHLNIWHSITLSTSTSSLIGIQLFMNLFNMSSSQ